MANTSQWYGKAASGIVADLWTPTQMGVALMSTSFAPNIDSDSQLHYTDSAISSGELPATGGYATGGKEILTRSVSYDPAANEYNLLGGQLIWGPGASFTARYGVIYEMASASKRLWGLLDFGGPAVVSAGNFQINWVGAVLSILVGPPV